MSNVHQPLTLLACDFVSQDSVKYIEPMRIIKLGAAAVLTRQPSQFLTFVSESAIFPIILMPPHPPEDCFVLAGQVHFSQDQG